MDEKLITVCVLTKKFATEDLGTEDLGTEVTIDGKLKKKSIN